MPITNVDVHIRVRNVARAAEWYQRMLGFKPANVISDPGDPKRPVFVRMKQPDQEWAIMISDGTDFLTARSAPRRVREAVAARKAHHVVSLYFWGERGLDVRRLYRSARRKGAKITQEVTDQPYGMREFTMQDPDGYSIGVGEVIAE